MHRYGILASALALTLAACGSESEGPAFPRVPAVVETAPVNTDGDAADDMAIWVHPTDPGQSVVIGTAKRSGIYVYDLNGQIIHYLPAGRVNNVDIRAIGPDDDPTWIVAASERIDKAIVLFRYNPETRQLEPLGPSIPTGYEDPYGFCLYKSPVNDALYAFVTEKAQGFGQWRIGVGDDGMVEAEKVRDLPTNMQSEGCVADDANQALYLAEEMGGIWRYMAEPDAAVSREPVVMLSDQPELAGDLEGLTIYHNQDGPDYLIASSQGNNSYAIFSLEAGYGYLGSFAIGGGDIDGTQETDGLDVTSASLGAVFTEGLFVAQDGDNTNPKARQNFKYVPWTSISEALSLK